LVLSRSDTEEDRTAGRDSRYWTAAAIVVFGVALVSLFHGFWGQDLTEVVLADVPERAELDWDTDDWEYIAATDLEFVVGLTARNAFTLLAHPGRLFQAEQCYPSENALALGEPMITFGILGIPAYWLTRDPVATFNIVVLELALLAAFAMYWLVREWTGIPAAGIVAGLLYAFHEIRMRDVVHIYAWDNAWTVLALLFTARLFRRPRWSDAIGLALCCALQIAGSFYPLLAAAVIALPVLVWLIMRHGIGSLWVAHWGLVIVPVGLVAFAVFSPYLELSSAGVLQPRDYQAYLAYSWLTPGEFLFPGWVMLALVLAGLTLGGRRAVARAGGDPRWALLVGGLVAMYLAAGGTTGEILRDMSLGKDPPPLLPNAYEALAVFIPGLDVVRAPGALFSGTHLTFCILAGLGAAAAIRITPRRYALVVAAALILLAYVDTLRPETLGLRPRFSYRAVPFRPSPEVITFFQKLAALGNTGPILEVPVNPDSFMTRSAAVFVQAYHRRPTSQCYNSYPGALRDEVKQISEGLPDTSAVRALQELGFTTIVVHHDPTEGPFARLRRQKFEEFVNATGSSALRRIHGSDLLTAYEIRGDVGDRP
jgi:hypothetical protein